MSKEPNAQVLASQPNPEYVELAELMSLRAGASDVESINKKILLIGPLGDNLTVGMIVPRQGAVHGYLSALHPTADISRASSDFRS
jgi:hypothetical protein